MLLGQSLGAQAEGGAVAPGQTQVLEYTFLAIGGFIALAAILAMGYLISTLLYLQKVQLIQKYSPDQLAEAGIKVRTEPLWKRVYKQWTQVVPIEREREVMLDHDYDGIRELDNRLPPWWLAIFYVTTAFAVIYIYVQHFSDYGISSQEEYVAEMEAAEEEVAAYLAQQADRVDENTVTVLVDQADLDLGNTIYQQNCASCHGQGGEGGVGPNMTDNYWLHGGSIKDVFKTIKYGVPEKGMISWKAQLRPADMQKVASFILTLQGTNPPNGKEPQGELYQAENVVETSDSTTIGAEATSMLEVSENE